MAYKIGNRKQISFLPLSIEEYVPENDPVRFYDAFIESINLNDLEITYNENLAGNSAYEPKAMLKLLVYGYSYGHKSSRELERALQHNLSFIWLLGGLKPSYKTISEFRRQNKKALQKVLTQSVKLCMKLNLIDGNVLFVDGSKFRASASLNSTISQKKLKKSLEKINERIQKLLDDCEKIDQEEKSKNFCLTMNQELANAQKRKDTIEATLKELNDAEETELNTTDPDSKIIHSQEGTHVNYNVQNVVDGKHGLIISSDTVNDKNDTQQFAKQINQANKIIGKNCDVACGDAGYANTKELAKIDKQGIKAIVPSTRQASKTKEKEFSKQKFVYDAKENLYICPAGKILKYSRTDKENQRKIYKIPRVKICKKCQHYGTCTKAKRGRQIYRLENAEIQEKLERQYEEPESQAIYKLRKEKVELPFGAIKHNLKSRSFLLRGFDGVKAEMSLLCSCYNLKRLINLIGLDRLINVLMLKVSNLFYLFQLKLLKNRIFA